MPLASIHPDAPAAHIASVAADKQGKFWEFHDKLFANQRNLKYDAFLSYAKELKLDVQRFETDFKDLSNKQKVDGDAAEARSLGLTGTPGFFINGKFLRGAQPFSGFAKVIDAELTRLNLPIPNAPPSS